MREKNDFLQHRATTQLIQCSARKRKSALHLSLKVMENFSFSLDWRLQKLLTQNKSNMGNLYIFQRCNNFSFFCNAEKSN